MRRGAEADVTQVLWHGRDAVSKVRTPKAYRHPDLDLRIRKRRTVREALMLVAAKKFGVRTPLVYFVDTAACTIVMQHIRGRTIQNSDADTAASFSVEMGRMMATLHSNRVAHGDPTTSNFIISGEELFAVDFGLAYHTAKPEDYAVDLRLVKEILNSAHAGNMKRMWDGFVSGYSAVRDMAKTLELVSSIERRGRYANVV